MNVRYCIKCGYPYPRRLDDGSYQCNDESLKKPHRFTAYAVELVDGKLVTAAEVNE